MDDEALSHTFSARVPNKNLDSKFVLVNFFPNSYQNNS